MKFIKKKAQAALTEFRVRRSVRRKGFWFVDIPRTGSSSLKAELGLAFGPVYGKRNLIEVEHATSQMVPDHLPATQMRYMLGDKVWDNLYTFTFVRNPFDRVVSLYNYLAKVRTIPNAWSFDEFLTRLSDGEQEYLKYVALRMSAFDFIAGPDDTVLVKEIFRFENRSDGIRKLRSKIKAPNLGRLHLQAASDNSRSYREHYDRKRRAIVEQLYAKDLEVFEYEY